MGIITIDSKKTGASLGDMFGIFFEDLNHAADGGLYPELVQNRSFEFDKIDNWNYHSLTAWQKVEREGGRAEISVQTENSFNKKNPHYLVLDILESGQGVGVRNLGFNSGIVVRKGQSYYFTCTVRKEATVEETLLIIIEDENGIRYGETEVQVNSEQWEKKQVLITATDNTTSGRLTLIAKGSGKICLDFVSLYPVNTFNNRKNGLRPDIAQLLADLKPKFMRFPGGCLVHDGSLNADDRNSLYRWKNTIGDLTSRPARRSNWGYNQTLGLGYYEYFLFCEDIGAKPIPVLPAGYDPHHKRIAPIEDLGEWINDALDLIEFANGDITTNWGKKRAELGHPDPFGLEYLAIGNEEVGDPFRERYPYFHKAIKEKYPDIKLINSSGPFAAGGEYEKGWDCAKKYNSDFVDEHYYQAPEWFLANHHRYDNFLKEDPKVFLGEYASWGNTYYNALVEASFMIGLQRNAHAVGLACYAPMLCNVDYVNWRPDMIWFNNHQVYGTPNYYVQKLFMNHQGDIQLAVEAAGLPAAHILDDKAIKGKLALRACENEVLYKNIKVINNDTNETICLKDIHITKEEDIVELDEIQWDNYTIYIQATKIDGPRGFMLYTSFKDHGNCLFWELGGWQNQDSVVCQNVNGRNSCLAQSLFTVEKGQIYNLELKVSDRSIETYVDGTQINLAELKPLIIEPLYYTASKEEATGDIILKVVNVMPVEVPMEIKILDYPGIYIVNVYEMSDYERTAENSFDKPIAVAPIESDFRLDGDSFEYTFKGESITVFRVSKFNK